MCVIDKLMTKNVITVNKQTPIHDAIAVFIENNITGLPVVDDDNNLVGIISEKDVLRLIYDDEDTPDSVENYMTKQVLVFKPEDDLKDVCYRLKNNHIRRVPIVVDGKLAGIISRRDIIKHILERKRANV